MVIRVAPNLFDFFSFILAHPTCLCDHVTRRHGLMTCTITWHAHARALALLARPGLIVTSPALQLRTASGSFRNLGLFPSPTHRTPGPSVYDSGSALVITPGVAPFLLFPSVYCLCSLLFFLLLSRRTIVLLSCCHALLSLLSYSKVVRVQPPVV